MMTQLQHLVIPQDPTVEEPLFPGGLEVTGQQEVDLPQAESEDDGVVVLARILTEAIPPGPRRMEQASFQRRGRRKRGGTLVEHDQLAARPPKERDQPAESRACRASRHPHFTDLDDLGQGKQALVVIGVGMADDQAIDALDPPTS